MKTQNRNLERNLHRVAVVYHFYAHYRAPILRELVQQGGYAYSFFGDNCDPSASGIASVPITLDLDFTRTTTRRFGPGILFQGGLLRLALRNDFQTIIFLGNAKFVMTWIAALLARLRGKRVLFWTHGWLQKEPGLSGWIRKCFYRIADGLLLYGNRAREIGLQAGFEPQNLYVIFNSLDTKRQQELRERLEPEDLWAVRRTLFTIPERPLLLGIGRLTKGKRFDLLIKAARALQESGLPVNVLLVGEGPEYDNLLDLAEEYGQKVHFYGACYDEAVLSKLITAANVCVVPGNIGLTVVHSLVYGTPVVSHDDPSTQKPEWEAIIPGINGGLYSAGDLDALVEAIRPWLNEGLTPPPVREQCYAVVDAYYRPGFQRCEIERAIAQKPAQEILISEEVVFQLSQNRGEG